MFDAPLDDEEDRPDEEDMDQREARIAEVQERLMVFTARFNDGKALIRLRSGRGPYVLVDDKRVWQNGIPFPATAVHEMYEIAFGGKPAFGPRGNWLGTMNWLREAGRLDADARQAVIDRILAYRTPDESEICPAESLTADSFRDRLARSLGGFGREARVALPFLFRNSARCDFAVAICTILLADEEAQEAIKALVKRDEVRIKRRARRLSRLNPGDA